MAGIRDPYGDNGIQDAPGEFSGPSNFGGYYNNPANGGGINPNDGIVQAGPATHPNNPSNGGGFNPNPGGWQPHQNQPSGSATNWTPEYINSYIRGRGGNPHGTSADYWMSKKAELDARGREINDPEYANRRLAYADELIGGPQNSPWATQRGGMQGGGGMNLGWLLQLLGSRMGPNQGAQAPPVSGGTVSPTQAQPIDINQIIMSALQRGF